MSCFFAFQLDIRQTYASDKQVGDKWNAEKKAMRFREFQFWIRKHGNTICNLLFVGWQITFSLIKSKWRMKFVTAQLWCDPFFALLLLWMWYIEATAMCQIKHCHIDILGSKSWHFNQFVTSKCASGHILTGRYARIWLLCISNWQLWDKKNIIFFKASTDICVGLRVENVWLALHWIE